LVVDDNETTRRIVRDMLGAEGMAVHEAPRADAGLEALRRAARAGAPYDLAILDAQMPDQDGFELATAVRADRALTETRLLILTSAGQRGDGERCRQLGIQAYLTKPIARADLVEAVGTVLAGTVSAPGEADLVTRHSIAESRHALRILLAEDNPVNQQVATAMLLKRGHQVDVVSNGAEAVDGILETFVATMPQRLDALAAAARDAEAEPLQRAAHAFKSAAGTIGAGRLAALLEDVERAARDGDVAGACDKLEQVRGEA